MGKSMKSSKVAPTVGQDGDSAGGIAGRSLERMYKVVEHLSDCVAWRSGVCAFPDCIEVAQLLHHRAKCRANQGTPAERLTEIYKQNDPPALAKLDRQLHSFKGREEELVAKSLKRYDLAANWCLKCAQGKRLCKVHVRHCDRSHCKVPGCLELRTLRATAENNTDAAEKLRLNREARIADRLALWPPFCCFTVSRKSDWGKVQLAVGRCVGELIRKYACDTSGRTSSSTTQALFGCLSFTIILTALIILFSREASGTNG